MAKREKRPIASGLAQLAFDRKQVSRRIFKLDTNHKSRNRLYRAAVERGIKDARFNQEYKFELDGKKRAEIAKRLGKEKGASAIEKYLKEGKVSREVAQVISDRRKRALNKVATRQLNNLIKKSAIRLTPRRFPK